MIGVFEKFLQKTPLFRLLLPCIVGVLVGDALWFYGVSYQLAFELFTRSMLWGIVLFVLLVCLLYRSTRFSVVRWWFGVLASLLFFCFGLYYTILRAGPTLQSWPSGMARYQAVVIEPPTERSASWRCEVMLTHQEADGFCTALHKKVYLYFDKEGEASSLKVGAILRFQAQIGAPTNRGNPYEYDYARACYRKQIVGTAFVSNQHWGVVGQANNQTLWSRVVAKAHVLRGVLLDRYLEQGIAGDEFAVLSAMTLGDRSFLTPELRTRYADTGASHILALSGLHLGILYMVLNFLLLGRAFSSRYRMVSQLVILLLVWAFVLLAGFPLSLIRAALMCSLFSLSLVVGMKNMSLNSLAFAGFVMLLGDPSVLFDVAFQLSFMAVFAILWLTPYRFGVTLPRNRLLRYLCSLLWLTTAAQLGVAPLILYYFHHFPLYFMVTNLFVVPFAFLLVCGVLLFFAASPWLGLQAWLGYLIAQAIGVMNQLLGWCADLPFASLSSIYVTPFQVVVCYALMATLVLVVQYPRASTVKAFLLVCVVGVVTFLYVDRRERLTPVLHIYNFPELPALHLVLAEQASYLFTGQDRPQVDGLTRMATPYWSRCGVGEPRVVSSSYSDSWLSFREGLLQCGGYTALMLQDGAWLAYEVSSPIKVDLLYLCGGFRGEVEELRHRISPALVVLDASLGESTLIRLYNECQVCRWAVFMPHKEGAFTVPLFR